ncbi:MAG: prolipoprotein diacylglyceryl transferase [Defluviitaleaceae bacterium]|nr:prolipoprotein diacylglyceryl transferase [Defluviitaleaceae bacterium]
MSPFINIFDIAIPVYGLLAIVAAFVAWFVAMLLSKKKKWIDSGDVSLAFLIGISGGVAGAFLLRPITKLVEVFIFWGRYEFASASEFFDYLFGEIVFYGGFLGGLIAIVIFCRKYKIKIIPLFDIFAPALALAHAIGRVGCFFGGCCYGMIMPYSHPLSIIYPAASLGAPSGVPLLAMPLIEASFLLILSIVLAILLLARKTPGLSASTYLIMYPLGRFILEFFRGDIIRGNYGLLTTSQVISVLVFIFGFGYFFYVRRKEKHCRL